MMYGGIRPSERRATIASSIREVVVGLFFIPSCIRWVKAQKAFGRTFPSHSGRTTFRQFLFARWYVWKFLPWLKGERALKPPRRILVDGQWKWLPR